MGKGSKDGNNTPAEIAYNFNSKKFKGNIALQGVIGSKVKASAMLKAKLETKGPKRSENEKGVKVISIKDDEIVNDDLPDVDTVYKAKTFLREGYLYLIDKNISSRYKEWEVLTDGSLRPILWSTDNSKDVRRSSAEAITSIKAFYGNPHDSKTIEPLLEQMEENIDYTLDELIYDRGGKGEKQIGKTKILTPDYKPLKRDTPYQKSVKRKNFRRRAVIEPVIGHLKTDFRMGQNYLHGSNSPQINAFLAATGWNLKKMMKKLKLELQKIFPFLNFNFFKQYLILID